MKEAEKIHDLPEVYADIKKRVGKEMTVSFSMQFGPAVQSVILECIAKQFMREHRHVPTSEELEQYRKGLLSP